jgi:hypothetical protein
MRSGNPFLWIIMLFSAYTVFIPGPMGLTRLRFAVEGFLFLQAWLGLRCLAGLAGKLDGNESGRARHRHECLRRRLHSPGAMDASLPILSTRSREMDMAAAGCDERQFKNELHGLELAKGHPLRFRARLS